MDDDGCGAIFGPVATSLQEESIDFVCEAAVSFFGQSATPCLVEMYVSAF